MPIIYEQRLNAQTEWALREGSEHFEGRGAVQETLRRITERLDTLGIEYALVGGMALFLHGLRRFTEDVNLIVTANCLQTLHDALDGRGYLPPFAGSRHLRDTETGVRIEFLVSGQYPGDGREKPVAFPEPGEAATNIAGISVLNLERLIEIKLASGLSGRGRLKDLADVQELIKLLAIPKTFAETLDPSVQSAFHELWDDTRAAE